MWHLARAQWIFVEQTMTSKVHQRTGMNKRGIGLIIYLEEAKILIFMQDANNDDSKWYKMLEKGKI